MSEHIHVRHALGIHDGSARKAFFAPGIDTDKFLEISKMILPEIYRHRY